jgi:hypothetical protein
METTGFLCSTCGQFHDELPLVFGAPAPVAWENLSPEERTVDSALSSDQCVIKGQHFFILGRLELPIIGSSECFTWLCWMSVSERNFARACEVWKTEGRESEPPYFAWVQSALPYPGGTLHLKANLITQPVGQRPLVQLQESDHLLYLEQSGGVTLDRVREIVEAALHEA